MPPAIPKMPEMNEDRMMVVPMTASAAGVIDLAPRDTSRRRGELTERAARYENRRHSHLAHELVVEALAVGLHQPHGGMREMHGHHERAGAGDRGEETSARARGLLAVPVEDGRPARLPALQGVVHEVADDHRALSARSDIHAA